MYMYRIFFHIHPLLPWSVHVKQRLAVHSGKCSMLPLGYFLEVPGVPAISSCLFVHLFMPFHMHLVTSFQFSYHHRDIQI